MTASNGGWCSCQLIQQHGTRSPIILQLPLYLNIPPQSRPRQTARRELDPQTRSRICELRSIGWSHRQIHQKYPQIPLGTIKTTLLRGNIRLNNVSRPPTGGRRRLTEEHRDRVWELAEYQPHTKIDELVDEVDHVVKKRSI